MGVIYRSVGTGSGSGGSSGVGGGTLPGFAVNGPLELYGFSIDNSKSDADERVKYLKTYTTADPTPITLNCTNANWTDFAYMDFTNNEFHYGSWFNAFFIKHNIQVLLNRKGQVEAELDPNNDDRIRGFSYSILYAGTNSQLNAMSGIPTCWVKYIETPIPNDSENRTIEEIYVSNKRVDNTFKAYAHLDENGDLMPYTYIAKFFGSNTNGVLRSCRGTGAADNFVNNSGVTEINYAIANNPTGKHMWNISMLSDWLLIDILLKLMAKSTNVQAKYGTGRCGFNSALSIGTMSTKGLFWGKNNQTDGVKVFGIENWWGSLWQRMHGLILSNGKLRVKLTYGTQDNSSSNGYDAVDGSAGTEYIDTGITVGTSHGGNTIVERKLVGDFGLFPFKFNSDTNGTSHECDGFWSAAGNTFALVGGAWGHAGRCGSGCVDLGHALSHAGSGSGARLSCKPVVNWTEQAA